MYVSSYLINLKNNFIKKKKYPVLAWSFGWQTLFSLHSLSMYSFKPRRQWFRWWWWFSHYAMSDSCDPMDSSLPRLLCPWNSPGKDTGVGCHFLLQGIFPTQGWNLGLLLCKQILYYLNYEGSVLEVYSKAHWVFWGNGTMSIDSPWF